jgi:hypothetical protein
MGGCSCTACFASLTKPRWGAKRPSVDFSGTLGPRGGHDDRNQRELIAGIRSLPKLLHKLNAC